MSFACFQNPATDRDLCYLCLHPVRPFRRALSFRILRRIETSATARIPKPSVQHGMSFQNPATDRDLCYSAGTAVYDISGNLSESCDGSRPLLHELPDDHLAPETQLSESCDGSRPLLPLRKHLATATEKAFQNPATDRDLCYIFRLSNPAFSRPTFRILRRIETSATAAAWFKLFG